MPVIRAEDHDASAAARLLVPSRDRHGYRASGRAASGWPCPTLPGGPARGCYRRRRPGLATAPMRFEVSFQSLDVQLKPKTH